MTKKLQCFEGFDQWQGMSYAQSRFTETPDDDLDSSYISWAVNRTNITNVGADDRPKMKDIIDVGGGVFGGNALGLTGYGNWDFWPHFSGADGKGDLSPEEVTFADGSVQARQEGFCYMTYGFYLNLNDDSSWRRGVGGHIMEWAIRGAMTSDPQYPISGVPDVPTDRTIARLVAARRPTGDVYLGYMYNESHFESTPVLRGDIFPAITAVTGDGDTLWYINNNPTSTWATSRAWDNNTHPIDEQDIEITDTIGSGVTVRDCDMDRSTGLYYVLTDTQMVHQFNADWTPTGVSFDISALTIDPYGFLYDDENDDFMVSDIWFGDTDNPRNALKVLDKTFTSVETRRGAVDGIPTRDIYAISNEQGDSGERIFVRTSQSTYRVNKQGSDTNTGDPNTFYVSSGSSDSPEVVTPGGLYHDGIMLNIPEAVVFTPFEATYQETRSIGDDNVGNGGIGRPGAGLRSLIDTYGEATQLPRCEIQLNTLGNCFEDFAVKPNTAPYYLNSTIDQWPDEGTHPVSASAPEFLLQFGQSYFIESCYSARPRALKIDNNDTGWSAPKIPLQFWVPGVMTLKVDGTQYPINPFYTTGSTASARMRAPEGRIEQSRPPVDYKRGIFGLSLRLNGGTLAGLNVATMDDFYCITREEPLGNPGFAYGFDPEDYLGRIRIHTLRPTDVDNDGAAWRVPTSLEDNGYFPVDFLNKPYLSGLDSPFISFDVRGSQKVTAYGGEVPSIGGEIIGVSQCCAWAKENLDVNDSDWPDQGEELTDALRMSLATTPNYEAWYSCPNVDAQNRTSAVEIVSATLGIDNTQFPKPDDYSKVVTVTEFVYETVPETGQAWQLADVAKIQGKFAIEFNKYEFWPFYEVYDNQFY
ncbi:hypothetical protein NVP1209O_18 [Vibrio phage 1.209.O._10N.222.52.B2]|nr:hypothetical protein NVP1209O_18 [Vibrio phage 1.209.O._10N.222.52.B2]